ncbi:SDR family oxidoreductase [Escherichia coli]|nr:SDR family oxidoreductase [Escherichia coli]
MKKFGKPEDIGWAAVYLASDAAAFVSGQVLVVDGGALIGF